MTIYWLCPKPATASGGVAFIHRLARLCVQQGRPAQVWQTEPFEVWWDAEGPFPDVQGLVRSQSEVGDVVVAPEVLLPALDVTGLRADGVRVIVFIQNHQWASKNRVDYHNVEIVTCSRYLDNWCRRVLEIKPVGMLSPYASAPWRTSPKTKDKTLVMARRNPELAGMMRAKLEASDFPICFLEADVTQEELAGILDSCEFYVHLTHPEGIPWAVAEAMQSGTITAGTTGGGGNEFMFHRETAMVVQDPQNGQYGDGLDGGQGEFTDRILAELLALRADDALRSRMWQNARNWVLGRYTRERTENQLKALFP